MISAYESGRITPSVDKLRKLAEILGVDVSYFLENEVTPVPLPPSKKAIPLYDTNMTAGNGTFPDSVQPIRYISTDLTDADCAFVVHGRSMFPEISEGDVILVKHTFPDEIRNGDIVVVIYCNQFLVKRFYRSDGKIVLVGDNEEYAPIVVDPNERFRLIGRVVEIRRLPKRERRRWR
ncbi:MAG: Putative prophage repressor [Thermotoga sp. 50_1627]|nr:MAG: Putative prophage repressor [Thermotoga sp. 50_1627]